MLPTKKSEPENDLNKYLILIYGKPKIGKTTLAAQFDDPLFIMFEPGAKSLSLYKVQAPTWKKFVEVVDELQAEKTRFKTVVLDTYARAYELCMEHVCKEMGIDHPQDAPYGKAWEAVQREFRKQIGRLTLSNRGTVLICHAKEKEIEQPDGTFKTMMAPDVKGQAMSLLNQDVDVYCYYYYGKNGNRYIRIQGTDEIVAGHRISGHFKDLKLFSAGDSPKVAYENLVRAFKNEYKKD